MKIVTSIVAVAILCMNSVTAFAGDAAAGKIKSASCGACHGQDGISLNDLWPNLAGQKEGYITAQLKAFRDGQRVSPMMSPMAAALSDADITNLAAYYASLGK